jgi:hypothetical protein
MLDESTTLAPPVCLVVMIYNPLLQVLPVERYKLFCASVAPNCNHKDEINDLVVAIH